MLIDPHAYTLNHIKINYAKRRLYFSLPFNKKIFIILKFLKKLSIISSFSLIWSKSKKIYYFKIILHYKYNRPLHGFIKLISNQKSRYSVSYAALKLLNRNLGDSLYVLSTPNGLMTHRDALNKRMGGKFVFFIYY